MSTSCSCSSEHRNSASYTSWICRKIRYVRVSHLLSLSDIQNANCELRTKQTKCDFTFSISHSNTNFVQSRFFSSFFFAALRMRESHQWMNCDGTRGSEAKKEKRFQLHKERCAHNEIYFVCCENPVPPFAMRSKRMNFVQNVIK